MVFMTRKLVVIYYNFQKHCNNRSFTKSCYTAIMSTRNSSAVRVVKPWNSLPEEVVTASTVRAFEVELDKFWKDQTC